MSESEQFSRTRLLIGDRALEKLKNSRVAVFGVGGVGGFVCEALVRSGIGAVDLIINVTALCECADSRTRCDKCGRHNDRDCFSEFAVHFFTS